MQSRWLVGLAATLLLLAGGAAGQNEDPEATIGLSATPPETPLEPGGPVTETNLTVTVTCQDGGNGTFEVGLTAPASPAWLTASLDPSALTVGWDECDDDADSDGFQKTVTLAVNASRDAPAFQQGNVEVQGTSDPANATTTIPYQPGFRGEIQADPGDGTVELEAGGSGDLPLQVTNLGNGDITVFLEVREDAGLDIVLPGAFTVPSPATGGEDDARNVTLSVQHVCSSPGPVDRRDDVRVHVDSAYALDQSLEGDEATATWTVHVEGTCPEAEASDGGSDDDLGNTTVENIRDQAPDLGAVGSAAALGVTAWTIRSRRRRT